MKKVHFVGICGAGMSAVAVLLKEQGWQVTGSDHHCHSPIKDYLVDQQIPYCENYSQENLPLDLDLVVQGGTAQIDANENPEIATARELGVPIKNFTEVLSELSANTENIVVTGSYGKSTITALIAHVLIQSGQDPNYFIGAVPLDLKQSSHLGAQPLFVIEGDEYPASQSDKQSKFLYFKPKDIIITSGQHDHVNVFPTPESYLKPYQELIKLVPDVGLVVANVDSREIGQLLEPISKPITYGLNRDNNPSWSAENITLGEMSSFDLTKNGKAVCHLETKLLGRHNIQNIIAASALLLEKKLVTPEELTKAVKNFSGIARRLELKTSDSTVPVYEGFGSSYDKAVSAIQAIRDHFPNRRLITVFEPHAFSWRNRNNLHWYDTAFKNSDLTLIYQPPVIGEASHDQATQTEILNRVIRSGAKAKAFKVGSEALELLKSELGSNDIVLLLSSGDLVGLIESIPKLVNEIFPPK